MPSVSGFGAKAIAAHAITEITLLPTNNVLVEKRLLRLPRKYLEVIEVAARIEMITPIENAEN
jgi:hypothetical protein